ncbi:MAG: D-glycero-beta-D-manno-heptose 1-phosphate adenylyltransferase [Acidobacteriota bacterium]|nr:D-glycero-beta-D-manno-heptose 1-phosphate adenylyltransferase [Acidobacteriota bacterium]
MAPSDRGVVDPATLIRRVQQARSSGQTIVFTNGCFDLLHAGHLTLLEGAARQGDRLIVAVNDDPSVRRLKGARRPLTPFEERVELLAGLAVVDWVVGFGTSTPLELIEAVQPDVLVKGDDWPLDRIVGRDQVRARGGRVVQVPLRAGRSTTALVRQVRNVDP